MICWSIFLSIPFQPSALGLLCTHAPKVFFLYVHAPPPYVDYYCLLVTDHVSKWELPQGVGVLDFKGSVISCANEGGEYSC